MVKLISIRPKPKKKSEKRTSTESKAKLELLTGVRLSSRGEIEDNFRVKTGTDIEEFEAADNLHEKDLFRRGLGFQQVASRGYAITPKNIQAYYELKLAFRERLEQDPNMERPLTREIYSLYLNAKNGLLQRSITIPQTNVEVVDQEPVVKYIPVPTYSQTPITDLEKKDEEE